MKKKLLSIGLVAIIGMATVSCGGDDHSSKAEEVAEEVADGVEDAGEEVDEAAEKTAEELEEAAEAIGNVFGK